MRFVHCTLKEKTCFGAMSLDKIFTWVEESYAVHHEMKSHTGGVMSMGLGVTHCIKIKTKLNTKSSTKAELVFTSGYLPYNIWYVMFMHYQGYLDKPNNFFQDKRSNMRMEVFGGNSCTGNLWHIHTMYFY